MPDRPTRPNPSELRRQADELHDRASAIPTEQGPRFPPAVPPTYPGSRVGMGKLAIPPKQVDPLPKAIRPDRKPTLRGLDPPVKETPIPGSVAPYKRSNSPPPEELAPDPQSAHQARRDARAKAAEQERRESIRPKPEPPATPAGPVLDSIKIEIPPGLRGGIGAVGKAIIGALFTALVGTGGAVVGSQAQIPPAVAECPAQLEQLRAKVTRLEGRADKLEDDEDEGRRRWRKTDDKAEEALGKASEIEKRTPKINP